jgi:hypothetical protein
MPLCLLLGKQVFIAVQADLRSNHDNKSYHTVIMESRPNEFAGIWLGRSHGLANCARPCHPMLGARVRTARRLRSGFGLNNTAGKHQSVRLLTRAVLFAATAQSTPISDE